MVLDSSNVAVGVTGAVSHGPLTAAAPTGTASAIGDYEDAGWIGEGGVTRTMPPTGDPTHIVGWQNGAKVRTIRTAPQDNPTYQFVMLETKIANVELALNVEVVAGATEGSFEIDTSKPREHTRVVLDVVDGEELIRDFIPKGIVTEIGDQVYANGEPIGWEVTVEAERDDELGYNAKQWNTRLKTPA